MVERFFNDGVDGVDGGGESSGGATEPDARKPLETTKKRMRPRGRWGGEPTRTRTRDRESTTYSECTSPAPLRTRRRRGSPCPTTWRASAPRPPSRTRRRGPSARDERSSSRSCAAEVERRRAGRDATRGARDLETARRARALANAKTTVCVGRARVALLRPTPRNGQVGNSPVGRTKRVSRAPCRVWMKKKQKAVQAQSAKTEIEKTRQFCRCCFLCVRSAPVSKRVPKLCFSDCKK